MEKKEIGKLLELLNEYVEEKDFGDDLNDYNSAEILDEKTLEVNGEYHDIEYLISKSFGFIKWLVENDKIDRDKVGKEKADYYFIEMFDNDEIMLMLLSISDTPIEDLISYLK